MRPTLGESHREHSALFASATRSRSAFGFRLYSRTNRTITRATYCPYPAALEKTTSRNSPGRRIDVVPLAVPAYTTYQGLNLLRREIDLLKPDVVTACFGWNDICPRPIPDRQSMPVDWAHVTVRWLLCHSQALIHFSRWSHTSRGKANHPNVGPKAGCVSWENYVANLSRDLETCAPTRRASRRHRSSLSRRARQSPGSNNGSAYATHSARSSSLRTVCVVSSNGRTNGKPTLPRRTIKL